MSGLARTQVRDAETIGLSSRNAERQIEAIRKALEAAGVEFFDEEPGARMKAIGAAGKQ